MIFEFFKKFQTSWLVGYGLPLKPQMPLFLAQIKRIAAAAITQRSSALITSAVHTHSVWPRPMRAFLFPLFFLLIGHSKVKRRAFCCCCYCPRARACVCVCVSNGVCKSRCPVDRNSRQLIKVRLLLSCPIISGLFFA